jgi:hypothetical protein
MKYLILLAVIFLFSLSSVYATDITSCYNITSSGYYRFIDDVYVNSECGFGYGCILINASDVTLNLNGYKLINNGSCSYGIVVLAKDGSDSSVQHNDISILNGYIYDFTDTGVEIVGATISSSFTYLIINSTQDSNGITLNSGYDEDLLISTDWFTTLNNGVIGLCGNHCGIYSNEFYNVINGLWLQDNYWIVEQNLMGYSIKNNTICYKDDYPIYSGIYCNNCTNSIIKNNDIMAQYGLSIVVDGNNNNITNNVFRTYYNYNPIFTFDSTTTDNIVCNNFVIKGNPTMQYLNGINTCYWGTISSNAYSLMTDLGTNSITALCTGICQTNWYCNGNYIQYINNTCGVEINNTCQYGCESGVYGSYCIGNMITPVSSTTTTVLTQKWNISYDEPVMNITDLQEAGLTWIIPFFTPTFLIIMFEVLIASLISWVSKQKMAFPITIFIMTATIGVYGVFSFGITLLVCIITALCTALLYKGMVK